MNINKTEFAGVEFEFSNNMVEIYEDKYYLVLVKLTGEIDEIEAQNIFDNSRKIIEISENRNKELRVVIDLTCAKPPTSNARKILAKVDAQDSIKKVALWGLNPVSRVIANFLMAIGKREKMRFFSSEKEAREWIEIE